MEKRTIDISTGIILRVILIALGIWFVYIVRDIIALLFIAFILTSAIEPVVDWMQRKGIHRSYGVLIIYVILFSLVGTAFSFLIPALADQFRDLSQNFPSYMDKLGDTFTGLESYLQSFGIQIQNQDIWTNAIKGFSMTSAGIFSTTLGVFSGVISFIVVLSLTFYLSAKEEGMKNLIISFTPLSHQEYLVSLFERIKDKIGKWLQGQLLLMLIIFVLYFIALLVLKIPYALALAIFGGVMEIIPYLGPILSAIPAVILGFLVSPLAGLLVLVSYIAIQQIEGHVIVPQVMRKTVGLNPVIVILALLVGAKLGGTIGAILAIPIAAAIAIFVGDIVNKKDESRA